jgi:hypothetical protein
MAAGGNYNPIASQVPTLFPAGIARALQQTAELPEPSGFAGVARRTLRPRTSIRAKLNWIEKSARQQQRAGEKKQKFFHGRTPFLEWIGRFSRGKLGLKSVDTARN